MWKSNGYNFDTVTELKETLIRLIDAKKSVKCICGNNVIWKVRKANGYIHNGAYIIENKIVCLRCHKHHPIKDFLDELKKLNLIDEKNIYDYKPKTKKESTNNQTETGRVCPDLPDRPTS